MLKAYRVGKTRHLGGQRGSHSATVSAAGMRKPRRDDDSRPLQAEGV